MIVEVPTVQVADPRVSLQQLSAGDTCINAAVVPPLWCIRGQVDDPDSSKVFGTELVSGTVFLCDASQIWFIPKKLYGTTTPPS